MASAVASAATSIGESFVIGLAAWAWAVFCAAALVKSLGQGWGIRISDRTLLFAAPAAILACTAATVLVYHLKKYTLLGIHHLEIEQPRLHWAWWFLIALEPIGATARFFGNRKMWARQALLARREYVIRFRLTEMLMVAVDAVIDWAGE